MHLGWYMQRGVGEYWVFCIPRNVDYFPQALWGYKMQITLA